MQLPPALQPWSDWLAWFAPDIAGGVGAMLMRLDPLLGLPSPARTHELAEPDGIDGLQRRGSYERLLLSEWAVADAMPDEFLRRAAGGEHLFLAPRRRATRVDHTLVALFDAGPAQLGAPRLAHIALWILLARRAAASGARFAWGVWQARGGLHDGGSPEMLARLLAARTFSPVTAAQRQRWSETLEEFDAGERWTIGAGAPAGTGATHVASIVHGFDGRLNVAISTPRGRRELSLAPPEGDVAKRLLRSAFQVQPAAAERPAREAVRFAMQQAPQFAWQNDHLAVPTLDESLAFVYRIPKTPSELPRCRPARWPARTSLNFATVDGRHLCGAMHTPDHLRLWQMGNLRQAPTPADFRIAPGSTGWRWCTLFRLSAGAPAAFVASDDNGTLARWTQDGASSPFTLITRNVIGATRIDDDHLVYARYVPSRLEVFRYRRDGTVAKLADATMQWAAVRCLFANDRRMLNAIAVETASPYGSRWYLDHYSEGFKSDMREVEIGENWKVIGLVRLGNKAFDLLALDDTRRRLIVAGRAGDALHVARHAIATASTSPDGTRIALVDHSRTLTVLDQNGEVLLQTKGPDRD